MKIHITIKGDGSDRVHEPRLAQSIQQHLAAERLSDTIPNAVVTFGAHSCYTTDDLRAAWEHGIKLGNAYGDNICHLRVAHKEQQWEKFLAARELAPQPQGVSEAITHDEWQTLLSTQQQPTDSK